MIQNLVSFVPNNRLKILDFTNIFFGILLQKFLFLKRQRGKKGFLILYAEVEKWVWQLKWFLK